MCGKLGLHNDQVCMPINGRVRSIDRCISHIVACLNAGGIETNWSCCGHNKKPGIISLIDKRQIIIYKNIKQCEHLFK